jgi:hypothetical protein
MTVTQARENLQFISALKIEGRISEQQADSLSAEHAKILDALIEETKFVIKGQVDGDQVIRVEGGLPTLPGCENVIMPQLNGHELNGTDIDVLPAPADPPADPPPTDPTP